MCGYTPDPESPVCPAEDQRRLLEHFLDRADNGSAWAANMLRMTPCDLWWAPQCTVWLKSTIRLSQKHMLGRHVCIITSLATRDLQSQGQWDKYLHRYSSREGSILGRLTNVL